MQHNTFNKNHLRKKEDFFFKQQCNITPKTNERRKREGERANKSSEPKLQIGFKSWRGGGGNKRERERERDRDRDRDRERERTQHSPFLSFAKNRLSNKHLSS